MKKQPRYITLLITGGLLMVTIPFLLKEYINIPDFFRGFLLGAGGIFEIAGIVLMNRKQKQSSTSCS